MLLFQCKKAEKAEDSIQPTLANSVSVLDSIINQINQLNQLSEGVDDFYDQATHSNQIIIELISGVKSTNVILELSHANLREQLAVVISKDTSMAVVSWDTRLGGTSPHVKSIILYRKKDKIESFALNEASSLRFDDIYRLNHETKGVVYLLKGTGQSSGVEFYSSIDAYTINNDLQKANIFPKGTNSITIGYDLDHPMDFKVDEDTYQIYVPDKAYPYNNWGVTYHVLYFDGENYQKETTEINFPIEESTFKGPNNYDDGYLKSSEKPIDSIQIENPSLFTINFNDGTSIQKSYSAEDETTELKITRNNSNQLQTLHFSSYDTRILAKKGQYLFIELSGTPSNSPLLVYDTDKQHYISSISQAGVKFHDDTLLFSQAVGMQVTSKEKPTCNPSYGEQTGYFEAFVLDYRSNHPTVKAIGMLYCGFSE